MALVSLNAEYRVPKREVSAEVTLRGQRRRVLHLFLNELAETHEGPERPSDLLNAPGSFFPAVEPRGTIVFIHREAVMVVSVSAETEFGREGSQSEELSAARGRNDPVEAVLDDGTRVRGMIAYLMPEGRNRLLDFLNTTDRFLTLREGEVAHLVNKQRIARVSLQ